MSDYYLCEHKQPCCGTCIRATKTELNKLEAERDALVKTIEERGHAFQQAVNTALQERDALRARVTKLEKALKEIAELPLYGTKCTCVEDCSCGDAEMRGIAKSALSEDGGGK